MSASAPVGFFIGILVAALVTARLDFWLAGIMAAVAHGLFLVAVPRDTSRISERSHNLSMDWYGFCGLAGGLLLLTYGMTSGPYIGWTTYNVLVPIIVGFNDLLLALWIEGGIVGSPLLPFYLFHARGVILTLLACIMFYGSYGIFLYYSVYSETRSWMSESHETIVLIKACPQEEVA